MTCLYKQQGEYKNTARKELNKEIFYMDLTETIPKLKQIVNNTKSPHFTSLHVCL